MAAAAVAGLLSIVRPIIYSQLKVHRASERARAAKTAAREKEGGGAREGRMPFRVQCMVFKISWCKVCLDFHHSIVGSDIGTPIWEFTWRVSKIIRKVYVHEVKDVM